jgi:hypothetical protein
MNYTKEQIEANLKAITDLVNSDVGTTEEKSEKLSRLASISALAAEMQGAARGLYQKELGTAIRIIAKEKYQASIVKTMAEGECWELSALYEFSVRCSAIISHNMEALRTQISLHKTELELSKFQ